MRLISIDTWAWFALANRNDSNHLIAQVAVQEFVEQAAELVTTNFVVSESATLIRYKLGHAEALEFLQTADQLLADGYLTIVHVTEAQEAAARRIFERYADVDFSYTDCVSFAVMGETGIAEVFAGDHHFTMMGFALIPV